MEKIQVTVHSPYSAKSKLHEMQFCETCRRQNALKMHFVCIAKRVAVNGVNSNYGHTISACNAETHRLCRGDDAENTDIARRPECGDSQLLRT